MEVDLTENQDQDQPVNVIDEEGLKITPKSTPLNPLLIPLIMDRIIEYLPFQDLKRCRLINTVWNKTVISSEQFQSKSKNFAVFSYHSKQEEYFKPKRSYTVGDMDRLGDCLRSPLRMRNFPLHTFIVGTSGIPTDSTLINFLNAISPVAQKIVIQIDFAFLEHKNEVVNWSVFPELKYLKLKQGHGQLLTIWKFLGHLMQRGNAPQLEKLYIRHGKSLSIPEESISKMISTMNLPVTITSKLTSLKMKKYPLQLQHLREFQALGLNLREFYLEVENISDTEAASTVRAILEKQSNTLSSLKIIDWKDHFRWVPTKVDIFPKLPNLETLIIDTKQIVFDNIILEERFPSLKSLIFTGKSSPWDDFFGNQIEPTLSINEVGVTRRLADEMILHKAVQYFPNIKKLQIPAVSNMTNVVFDKLSQIEELTLDTTNIVCIDHIITGMTLKECEDALGRMTDWRKNIEVLANIRDMRLTTMPISCLTKLRTLRLFSMSDTVGLKFVKKKVEITKLSFLMVLLQMDSLRCIDFGKIYFPPDYQLQPSVWKKVCGRFKILYNTRKLVE